MKVIFLDIDGVLITAETCRQGFGIPDPKCVECLNRLTKLTGAVIVVSSCWRIGMTVEELQELLAGWGVTGKVIDKTPHAWTVTRGQEITCWLGSHIGVEWFVIIDDDSDMDDLLKYLVKTDFMFGLTEEHVNRIVNNLVVETKP